MQGPMRSGILETYIYTLAYSATPVRTVLYCFFVLRSVLLEETNITPASPRPQDRTLGGLHTQRQREFNPRNRNRDRGRGRGREWCPGGGGGAGGRCDYLRRGVRLDQWAGVGDYLTVAGLLSRVFLARLPHAAPGDKEERERKEAKKKKGLSAL